MDDFKFEESPSISDPKNTVGIEGVINLNESKAENAKVSESIKKTESKAYSSVNASNQFAVSTLDEPVSTTLVRLYK